MNAIELPTSGIWKRGVAARVARNQLIRETPSAAGKAANTSAGLVGGTLGAVVGAPLRGAADGVASAFVGGVLAVGLGIGAFPVALVCALVAGGAFHLGLDPAQLPYVGAPFEAVNNYIGPGGFTHDMAKGVADAYLAMVAAVTTKGTIRSIIPSFDIGSLSGVKTMKAVGEWAKWLNPAYEPPKT